MFKQKKYQLMSSIILLCGLFFSYAQAHIAWIEPELNKTGNYIVLFGEGPKKVTSYKTEKIKNVLGISQFGEFEVLPIHIVDNSVHIESVTPDIDVLVATFKGGIYSHNPVTDKYENLPMNQVKGSQKGMNAFAYTKRIIHFSKISQKPVGHRFELVLLDDPHQANTVRVQALFEGNPVAGIKLKTGDQDLHTAKGVETDNNGIAVLSVKKGENLFAGGYRQNVPNDETHTTLAFAYALNFYTE